MFDTKDTFPFFSAQSVTGQKSEKIGKNQKHEDFNHLKQFPGFENQ